MDATPKIDTLVLDAAPLLSLSPLRGLAKNFVTIPQVIGELKDQRAREHFEQLGLAEGVNVEVRNPDASSVAAGMQRFLCFVADDFLHRHINYSVVSAAAKKSGDFAVLSRTDLLLLSLTYSLHMEMEPSISVPSTFTSANVSGLPFLRLSSHGNIFLPLGRGANPCSGVSRGFISSRKPRFRF